MIYSDFSVFFSFFCLYLYLRKQTRIQMKNITENVSITKSIDCVCWSMTLFLFVENATKMLDPYDFVASPSNIQSRQTCKKSIIKTSKKRRSNEKSRYVSIRQANSKQSKSTRSNMHEMDHLIDVNEKENNPNTGFTQLVETKMLETKKRQGKRTNKKVKLRRDENQSALINRKRQRSGRFNHKIL